MAGVKIWVNDVALTSNHHCIKFGRLNIGDIITLLAPWWNVRSCCELFYGADLRPRTCLGGLLNTSSSTSPRRGSLWQRVRIDEEGTGV